MEHRATGTGPEEMEVGNRQEWSTGREGMDQAEEMEHRAYRCSRGQAGQPEYLPYLNADSECSVPSVPSVCSVPSEFSEEFCCSRNLREGQSGRRAFVKLTGKRGGKKKLFLQNKPISKLPISS